MSPPAPPPHRDALGGYFGVEPTGAAQPWPWPGGLLYQSGRAAFLALVECLRPEAVWMPWFICDAMCEPLAQAGIRIRRYALGADFRIAAAPSLAAREALLYVNYFGLCGDIVSELETTYPREQLIVDHAQALYAAPAGIASIYSPRKFVGVPDGGILLTALPVPPPDARDDGSEGRLRGPRLRDALGAEAGRAAFREAEASLSGLPPLAMSLLTQHMLAGIDHAGVAEARRRNFEHLHVALRDYNRLRLCQPSLPGEVPLCYPFWPARAIDRALLHRAGVFVPTYWPELIADRRAAAPERRWAQEWLHLPIDQRCDTAQLQERIVEPLVRILGRREPA